MNQFQSTLSEDLSVTPFTPAEVDALRRDTPGCSHVVHLNYAGAGLMPTPVIQALHDHLDLEARIGGYEAAAMREHEIRSFYTQAARLLNTKPGNIAFTSSATDSYSRALSSIPFRKDDVILTTNDDFVSNQIQFLSCQKRFGVRVVHVENAPEGGVSLEDLDVKLRVLRPRLLAITHVPTNAGLVQPVYAIGKIAAQYPETYYLLDACQSAGQMKLDVQRLHCDFLSVTTRKFLRGPRGTGFLYISDKALTAGLEPLFLDMRGATWKEKDLYVPQPDATRFEDWEFAYALMLGSSKAIEYCLAIGEDRIEQRVKMLASYLRQRLQALPGVRVLDHGPDVCGLVTFTVTGGEPVSLVQQLRNQHINIVPSYRDFAVLDFDEKGVSWALRASPHYLTTTQELDFFVSCFEKLTR
jgi:selenocysteine lyase/cysteine desulfurase